MSSIVEVTGTRTERQKIEEAIGASLYFFMSIGGVRFYLKDKTSWTQPQGSDADVISIPGKYELRTLGPGEPRDFHHHDDAYLSPDHYVVLTNTDTMLYHLQSWVPHTHAELAMIRGFSALLWGAAIGVVAGGAALWLGFGLWSVPAAILGFLLVLGYFMFIEIPLRASAAALCGALYVWKRVLFDGRSRSEYRDMVGILAQGEIPYLTPIMRRLLVLI